MGLWVGIGKGGRTGYGGVVVGVVPDVLVGGELDTGGGEFLEDVVRGDIAHGKGQDRCDG